VAVGGTITNTNWAANAQATVDARALPGAGDVVRFAAAGVLNLDTTVGGTMSVAGLTTEAGLAADVAVSGGSLELGGQGVRLNAPVILTINSTLSASAGSYQFAAMNEAGAVVVGGAMGGAASVVKSGPGGLMLAGQNSYTGGTTVNDGLVVLGGAGGLPVGTRLTVAQGMFDLGGWSSSVGDLAFGSATLMGARSLTNSGAAAVLTVAGDISFHGSSNTDGTPTGATAVIEAAISLTVGMHQLSNPNGQIANGFYDMVIAAPVSGAGGLQKTGSFYNVALTAANSYGGATVIAGGTLYAAAVGALPPTTALTISSGALRLNPTSGSGGVPAGSYAQTVASLSGTGGRIDLGAAVLTVGDESSTSFLGTIAGAGGGIVKQGGGTLRLGRVNTYTGDTRVLGGRLGLDASFVSGVGITIGPGAVLEVGTAGMSGALVVRARRLDIGAGGVMNLNSHDFVLDYTGASPLAGVVGDYLAGRIMGAGSVGGLPTYLAIAEAADLGVFEFAGVFVDETAVLIKHTYVGDANLDGQVDALDYERIDLAIGNTGVLGTARGDLNYDGVVDALDYEQIDLNIGNGVGLPLGLGGMVVVPEPGVVGLTMLVVFAARRRVAR
jgi:autotransporter-associated beta strand protein